MARRQRYYSDDDIERGITPSELKRAGRERQKAYMLHWFHRNFEDPSNETPRDDGEFIYIWGGPYDAHEQLFDEFSSLVPEDRIQKVADEVVNEDGIYDWAPGPDHPSTKEREEDWYRDQEEHEESAAPQDSLEQITNRLQSGVKPTYGDGYEQEQRRAAIERLDTLRSALATMTPAHGGIGHNRPPPDDDSPQALAIGELEDAEQTISRELAKEMPDALQVANATSRLRTALGWLTVVQPGYTCQVCRGLIKTDIMLAEALRRCDPAVYQERRRAGYVVGAPDPNPVVVTFTTEVACLAVNELFQRLNSYRGDSGSCAERVRKLNEVKDADTTPGASSQRHCKVCGRRAYDGRGDMNPFLDMT